MLVCWQKNRFRMVGTETATQVISVSKPPRFNLIPFRFFYGRVQGSRRGYLTVAVKGIKLESQEAETAATGSFEEIYFFTV